MAAKDGAGGVDAPEVSAANDLHFAARRAGTSGESAARGSGSSSSASDCVAAEGDEGVKAAASPVSAGVSAGQAGESKRPAGGVSRRGFVLGSAGGAAMLALGLVKFAPQTALVRPPGGQDADRLLGMCIRCGKCMEVCPNGVIAPAHIEDGVVGVRTPRLSFSRSKAQLGDLVGWCDHCDSAAGGNPRCAQVCPSGALDLPPGSTFDTMRLGCATINHDWCLAWRLKGCTICLNACPLGAISFDSNNRPVVDERLCNGCGACEQACVSLESTSIGQDENNKHMTARAITVQALER